MHVVSILLVILSTNYKKTRVILKVFLKITRMIMNEEFPPKYKYFRNLIPVVLDLHSVQFSCWSSLFRDVAWANNLLHHIDPTVPTPPPDINVSIDDHTSLWCEQDSVVLTWIYATITPYLLRRLLDPDLVTSTTSAMDAWTRIRDICEQHNTAMQRKKRKYIHIDLNEDYRSPGELLSNLPDHLLIYILSLAADIKTAGRTSILSKRWITLWTDLMDLHFEDLETMTNDFYAQPGMDKFVDWVNKVIAANRAPYLGTFRIHFQLNRFYAAHIENWLKFAFVKKVRNLELNLLPSYSRINFFKIFSNNPASILNTTLESLHLKSVNVERHFLQWVITNCLNLQSLSLHHCNDASSKHCQKLVISSLKLKRLELFHCFKSLKIDSLHLSAPNLTSFIFNEHESKIDVQYCSVPSLVDVTFGGSYFHRLKALSGFSTQIEKLSIVWDKQMCRTHLAGLWNSLAAKNTQSKVMWHLKTVEYLGYAGCSFSAELAVCLTQLAPMLQRFIFDTRQPQFAGNPCEVYTSDHSRRDQMEIARRKTELFEEYIRGSYGHVDVVIR